MVFTTSDDDQPSYGQMYASGTGGSPLGGSKEDRRKAASGTHNNGPHAPNSKLSKALAYCEFCGMSAIRCCLHIARAYVPPT